MLPRLSLRTRPLRRIVILSTSLIALAFFYRSGSLGFSSSITFSSISSKLSNDTSIGVSNNVSSIVSSIVSTSAGSSTSSKTADASHATGSISFHHHSNDTTSQEKTPTVVDSNDRGHENGVEQTQIKSEHSIYNQSQGHHVGSPKVDAQAYLNYEYNHTEIFSASSKDKTYLKIDFSGSGASDPSLIPHPILKDTWIIVAKGTDTREEGEEAPYEYACNAMLNEQGILHCTTPAILPIAPPWSPSECPNSNGRLKITGARHSRIFYGPNAPYLSYQVQAEYTCPGHNTSTHSSQYIQDLRSLIYLGTKPFATEAFTQTSRLGIPATAGNMDGKDWFLFWDINNQTYAHYSISPKRVYGKVERNSSVVKDMSTQLPASDANCLREYMPPTGRSASALQATNSLSITTCKRADEDCEVSASNTFIMAIFQHRIERGDTTSSEPYIILFDRTAPFATHGIGKRPLWIAGRGGKTEPNEVMDASKAQKLNIMSMSWKHSTQKYHGYADDVIHMAFGIEGKMTGVIDVVAGDLLEDLRLCSGLA